MPMLVNNLSTGDVMVFDKEKRDLYLIPKHNAKQWHDARDKSLHFVKELAERGTAKHFDRVALAALQAALSHIVLLAVPGA